MPEFLGRTLDIRLPKGQSAFLWGPRKTGKTTLLCSIFPSSAVFDFLDTDLYFACMKRPALFREMVGALPREERTRPIIVDEVQKVPAVLDEIHSLIEKERLSFLLCGSSARKLKRGHVNLLGGRAWRFELFPLTSHELGQLDLLRALNQGLIPAHYLAGPVAARRSLTSYLRDYLAQEVFAEGLVRNMPAFSRFFDAVGYAHGELINFANVARECGVDAKTAREDYQILVDTLLGVFVEPFSKRQGRQVLTKTPKFYLFDVGVAGALTKRTIVEPRGLEFGKAFEHFILMELLAYRSYSEQDFRIEYWRTSTGLEVDFILDAGRIALEVKSGGNVDRTQLAGLRAFLADNPASKGLVVTTESRRRTIAPITLVPWTEFLQDLWKGKILD